MQSGSYVYAAMYYRYKLLVGVGGEFHLGEMSVETVQGGRLEGNVGDRVEDADFESGRYCL